MILPVVVCYLEVVCLCVVEVVVDQFLFLGSTESELRLWAGKLSR